jgi:3'(2'), 5'-bisphosphate nucleotidase
MKPIFPLILPHIAHAGSIIESFKSSFSVTNKADESPVTEADIQASAYLVKNIHELFPEDLVLSEEDLTDIDFSQRIWLIDPLDGTKNFIK